MAGQGVKGICSTAIIWRNHMTVYKLFVSDKNVLKQIIIDK